MDYVIYKDSNGQVLSFGTVPDTAHYDLITPGTGNTKVEETIESDLTWYFPAGVKTARPLLTTANSWNKTTITANGTDTAVFGASLPNPTAVTIITPPTAGITTDGVNKITGTVTDGTLTITATKAGGYVVTLKAFPYQDYTVTITAT